MNGVLVTSRRPFSDCLEKLFVPPPLFSFLYSKRQPSFFSSVYNTWLTSDAFFTLDSISSSLYHHWLTCWCLTYQEDWRRISSVRLTKLNRSCRTIMGWWEECRIPMTICWNLKHSKKKLLIFFTSRKGMDHTWFNDTKCNIWSVIVSGERQTNITF